MVQIQKRDGSIAKLNPNKILNRIKRSANGLKVNSDQVFIKVITSIPMEGSISTKELDELIANTAAPFISTHYDYSKLASAVSISSFHKSTNENIYELMSSLRDQGVVHSKLIDIMDSYGKDNVQAILNYEKDYNFDYFAWKTFESMYLLKDSFGKVVERPQQMYLRIALWLTDTLEEAKELYELLSDQLISCATPIMLNSGTANPQLSSCVLHYNNGDSRPGLLETFNDISNYSSNAAGIGLCMSNIRSKESKISTSGGYAGGLLKYLKIVNEGLRFFNQNGKRPGSAAIYIEPWHKDIFDFLSIKKNMGDESARARDIFTALWIPDNFMRAVENDDDWYLFCPNDIKKAGLKPLQEAYGQEYEILYNRAVELGLGKKVKAQDIWIEIYQSQVETGVPYMLYKDHVNNKTNHKNYGVIKSSNLCAEIVEYTDEKTTAICTLASQVIKNYFDGKKFDFNLLRKTTHDLVKILNKVIDINYYVTEKGKRGGLQQRAIAIGIQGLADLFYLMDISFTSEEAKKMNKLIFETIYFSAIEASCELVKSGKQKTYDGFEGSPISQGIFQYQMWGLNDDDLSGMWDWASLREDVIKYGVCNSLFTAQMPVASSAKITGSYEMTEPMDSNLFNRRVIGGEFLIPNKYLINDLEKLGIWNEQFKNEIILNNGSIQNINMLKYIDVEDKNYDKKVKRIEFILEKYKTVWEIKQKDLIDLAADRAVFIDQTQSMNIYMAAPTLSKITSSHFYAWKKGLKTGSYYLRTKPISTGAKHLGIDVAAQKVDEPLKQKPVDSKFDCDGCSA